MAKDKAEVEAVPAKRPLFVVGRRYPAAILAAVKSLKRWDDLFEVSESELAQAVKELDSIHLG
jgi:hypothetical protein